MDRIRILLGTDIIRNFLKLLSATIVAQGLSFALSPLFSRLYTPEEFGLVALYMSLLSILSVLATAKYEQAIMLPREDGAAINLLGLVLLITAAVSVFCLMVVVFFNSFLARVSGNPDIGPWLYWLPLSLLLHGLFQGATFFSNRKKLFGIMASGTVVQYGFLNGVRLAAGLLRTPFNGLIAGQLAAQISGTAFMLARTQKKLRTLYHQISWNEIRQQGSIYSGYPRYNMMLNFTNNLSGSLPVFMFTWGFSAEAAGLYAFGYTFVFRPLSLFSQSTQQVLSQKIIEDFHQGKWVYPALKKLVLRFFLLGIIPFMLLALLGPWLFGVIFSEAYARAGSMLQVLTPWLFLVFLTSPLSFIPELFFRQKKAMIIDMIYLVLRFFALGAGIWHDSIWLALGLFSAVSTAVVLYNLLWYLHLARNQRKGAYSSTHETKKPGL